MPGTGIGADGIPHSGRTVQRVGDIVADLFLFQRDDQHALAAVERFDDRVHQHRFEHQAEDAEQACFHIEQEEGAGRDNHVADEQRHPDVQRGEFFQNQISIQKGDVLFNSQLLDKEIDINDTKYNTYHWNAIGKQTKDYKQKQIVKERESVFINQNKKNIPDIVCERILENPKYERPQKSCCILDAKYYGWDYEKEAYYLPRNLDIYKQFFYQEQFQRIYEKENETNVGVYNFLVLPDYLGDTKDTKWGIIRQCAVIEFDYHQNQKIAVLQVDIEKLVDFIYSGLDMKEDVLSVFLGNNRVVPMIYGNEKV